MLRNILLDIDHGHVTVVKSDSVSDIMLARDGAIAMQKKRIAAGIDPGNIHLIAIVEDGDDVLVHVGHDMDSYTIDDVQTYINNIPIDPPDER